MTVRSDDWIRRFHPSPQSSVRLAVLPHAGGSASYYHRLSQLLVPEVEVLAVQYPGRQDRRTEPPIEDIPTLADQVVEALRPWSGQPLALFGHSMGATVAFETARRLETEGTPPLTLFASGRRAPSVDRAETVHLADDAGLKAEVAELSGTDPRVFDDEELWELMVPTIRSDYRAVETYRCPPGAQVDCPVTAMIGDSDPRIRREDAAAWARHTTAEFELQVFTGGHFYLADEFALVADRVRDGLRVSA